MANNTATVHRKLAFIAPLLFHLLVIYSLDAIVRTSGFVPKSPALAPASTRRWKCLRGRSLSTLRPGSMSRMCLEAAAGGTDKNSNASNEDEEDKEDYIITNEDKMVTDFFFDMSKSNINGRCSMDVGIYDLLGPGNYGGIKNDQNAKDFINRSQQQQQQPSPLSSSESGPSTVVVMDWECLLDALPYHIELGIHAARTLWPHLNDLCNFDTDRDWLENKLFAMSHVLGHPEGTDHSRHVACEYALATRLILEEQALDRNESTGKNGRYARKFHPRAEINGNKNFEDNRRSRRPLTAGELSVNWREFIRATLIVKYSRPEAPAAATEIETSPQKKKQPKPVMDSLEQAIVEYLSSSNQRARNLKMSATLGTDDNENESESLQVLPLFPQTKFALRNSSSKLVVRISHKFDNDIVARSLNQQLQLLPHQRIAKTYKPETAIRRMFVKNVPSSIVLLLKPDYKYEFFNEFERDLNRSSESILGSSSSSSSSRDNHQESECSSEESCLRDIMKFAHHCDNAQAKRLREQQDTNLSEEDHKQPTTVTSSVVWIDSSWHRLQDLAYVFGDTIPGRKNGNQNTGKCSFASDKEEGDNSATIETKNHAVWLSLWLAEWPSQETSGSSSSESTNKKQISSSFSQNHEAAMVYPWTDSLSWETAEDILMTKTWGSSDTAFQ